nr:PREDICTED: rab3 GTPase-activating protein catalytic subunit [Bemisia tabaci]
MIQDSSSSEFYHQDFTTASEWEIFIARLEEIFFEWKLSEVKISGIPLTRNQLFEGPWEQQSDTIKFSDVEYTVTRHFLKLDSTDSEDPQFTGTDSGVIKLQALEDMMSPENDFLPVVYEENVMRPHPLVRWYGLRDFITIVPPSNQPVCNEGRIKMLLSSFCIALNNSECKIPLFIQANEPWQNFYLGICEGKGIRAEYETAHLRHIPQGCKHLTGILHVFKSKIGSPIPLNSTIISARFSYSLHNWTSFVWQIEPPDFDSSYNDAQLLSQLPFGTTFDPVSKLMLYVSWPELFETSVVDSESYTDLEPLQAKDWSVSVKYYENPSCLLSDALTEFLGVCSGTRTVQELIGDIIQRNQAQALDPSIPLSVLSESKVPTFSKILKQAASTIDYARSKEGPISEELLIRILYYLFPDAENEQKHPYPESFPTICGKEDTSESSTEATWLNGFKSAPSDSLVWRLATVMCHAAHSLGGAKAVAHLWYEFTQELRFRWERCIFIPGVAFSFPDMKTCLLNQKLQMLNCCMRRREAREKSVSQPQELKEEFEDSVETQEEEEEEEFFECDTGSDIGESGTRRSLRRKVSVSPAQPAGRLSRHGELKLIATGDPLYVPVTQEPIPKSEDQLEEDAALLTALGTDKMGAELRARIMSASLLSDMEAFKAANPGAVIEDFIRWYSPRDWIESDEIDEFGQKKGQLSARMQLPGNTWLEVWQTAKAIPARRQKQLFDDAREAEKVLHFLDSHILDSRPLANFAQLLLPTLSHVALSQLLAHSKKSHIEELNTSLRSVSKKAVALSRSGNIDLKRYQDLINQMANVETVISQSLSLQFKFCPNVFQSCNEEDPPGDEVKKCLSSLLFKPETVIPSGSRGEIGSRIVTMFTEAHKVAEMISDPEPVAGEPWDSMSSSMWANAEHEKEFILRSTAFRPASCSALTPQRLTVRVSKEQFAMAGCWTQDTTFQ